MKKKWVDPDDAPPLTGKEIHRPSARWRIAGKVVSPEEGKAAFRAALRGGKTRVNIHLDNDIIAHFKQVAGARGYQTLINAALRKFIDSKASQGGGAADASSVDIAREITLALRANIQELTKTITEKTLAEIQVAPGLDVRWLQYPRLNVLQWKSVAVGELTRVAAPATQANNEFQAFSDTLKGLTHEETTTQ
jgi:uncharacterized protein (DUF4415 family)